MKQNETKKSLKILLSSGGTGGHMSPASALAATLKAQGHHVILATDTRGMKYAGMFEGIETHTLNSGTAGAGFKGKIKGALGLASGILQATKLLRRLRPDVVVGFGGYPSVPAVMMAQAMRIPTILHEQNAILGKANAFLAPRAKYIGLSVENYDGLDEKSRARAIVTGNPVRAAICALHEKPYIAPAADGTLNILVMGGSLGASVFSDIVPKTLSRLSPEYKNRLRVIQQCREAELPQAEELYNSAGIKATLAPFIHDVAKEYTSAHLFIGRSGASTVAEITIAGIPAIFVPYPHHKDQQQKMNADAVADHGGAWVMTENGFTQEALLARIETFLQNPDILVRAAEKSRAYGKADAAEKLAELVMRAVI